MPKGSELPWGTILTGLVAIYGAVLSTVNLVAQRARDRVTATQAQKKQAEQVTAWLDRYDGPEEPDKLFYGLVVQNTSDQLVHDAIASIVKLTDINPADTRVGDTREPRQFRTFVGALRPGQTKTRIENPGQGMHIRFGVELAFQDAAGAFWLRQGNGVLKRIEQHPLALYGIPRPARWEDSWGVGVNY
jgi:hypothetical protein